MNNICRINNLKQEQSSRTCLQRMNFKWRNLLEIDSDGTNIEINRKWEESKLFINMIHDMNKIVKNIPFDFIVGIESTGVIFASALAYATQKPLTIITKDSKRQQKKGLTKIFRGWRDDIVTLNLDIDGLSKGRQVLIVDDFSQTLQSFKAARELIENSQNSVSAFLCVANISGIQILDGIPICSLVYTNKSDITK
jgi:adenine phosphoribosyltransferase